MKKITLFIALVVSFFCVYRFIGPTFEQKSRVSNFNLYTISQTVGVNVDNSRMLSGQKKTFSFRAIHQNLGSVEVLVNNYGQINKDKIVFRIKKEGDVDWMYQNTYQTSSMDVGQFFPFGFSPISESKNKKFIVEIESLNGTETDSVSFSDKTRLVNVKYLYNKEYLLNNYILIPEYVSSKIVEFLKLFSIFDFIKYIFLMASPVFMVVFFSDTKFYKLTSFLKLNNKSRKIDKGILAILIVYLMSHLKFLDYSQYWDSDWYWQLLLSSVNSVINFSGGTFIDFLRMYVANFNFLGHPSMFYMSYLSIGQYIDFGNVVFMNLQNVLLAMVGIYGFYRIFAHLFPENKYSNLVLTLLFAFNPLFYATTISLNTDMPILVLEILLVLSLLNNRISHFLLWSIAIIFSKETGILIYLSLVVSYILIFRSKREGLTKRLFTDFFVYLIPFFVFAIYFYLSGSNMHSYESVQNTGNSLKLVWDDNGFFTFGLNSRNFFVRFFQLGIMNFAWVGLLIILIAKIKSVFLDESIFKDYVDETKDKIRFVLYSSIPFVILTFLFITMDFSRYVVPVVFYFCLLMYVHLQYIVKNIPLRFTILVVICLLNIIQTFRSIDPSAGLLYGFNRIGSVSSSPVFGFRDGLVYNSQFVFVDRLSKLVEKEVGNRSVVIDSSADYFFKRIMHAGTVNNIENITDDKIVYIYIPWFDNPNEGMNKIKKYYSTTDQKKIEYIGYYVVVYYLDKIK